VSGGWRASVSPICARLSAPVRAYISVIPLSTMKAPRLLVIAKLIAPCSGPRSSMR
jgi:hypothetical protein